MDVTEAKALEAHELKVGDTLVIWITGMVGEYHARVVEVRESGPRLRVLTGGPGGHLDESWPSLKHEDFIIRRRA